MRGHQAPVERVCEHGHHPPAPEPASEQLHPLHSEQPHQHDHQQNRLQNLLLFIFANAGDVKVGITYLNKILYFLDFDYYELHESHLLGCEYRKLQHGPVCQELDPTLEKMQSDQLIEPYDAQVIDYTASCWHALVHPDMSVFTKAENTYITSALNKLYGFGTATNISDFSHSDMPWMAASQGDALDYDMVFYRDNEHSVAEYDEI